MKIIFTLSDPLGLRCKLYNIAFLRKMRYDVTDLNEVKKYRVRKCHAPLIKWSAHSICSTHSIESSDNYQ
jgi:hypothetical protein